jgi:hypothetical protein
VGQINIDNKTFQAAAMVRIRSLADYGTLVGACQPLGRPNPMPLENIMDATPDQAGTRVGAPH